MSDSTESSAYFYRVISLVVDVGTVTLRDIFYSKVPKSNVATLFATREVKTLFTKLKGKSVLTQVQYDKVTNNPDPDTFDISLLITLLTNKKICETPEPVAGWASAPLLSDISLGADLLRFREIRNEIIAHRSNAQLEVHEFKRIWGDVEIVLVRIAGHVNATEVGKIKDMIRNAEKRKLEPLHEREKKLLQEFIGWQKEDNKKVEEQLSDMQNSLQSLNIKVDGIRVSKDEPDAARSSITSEDALSSIQSQVNNLFQSLGCIAKQDDVMEIQQNMKQMENNVKAITDLMALLKQTVDESNRNLEELSKNSQTSASVRGPVEQYAPDRPKKPKITNPNAMSEREIDALSRKIGTEWESLRIHLDFTEAQGQALKWAYNDSILTRIYQMLKAWHDVVVECGENPKMLLAAAFVNASTNYRMAYEIVPKHQFDARALAKPATVERIQKITFRKTGFDQGDVFYDRPGSGAAYRPGGPGSFNIYGGEVRFDGRLNIQHQQSSYVATDRPDASFSGDNSLGSFNVYDGKVYMSNVVMGPPSQGNAPPSHSSMTAAPNFNSMTSVRGEVVPDFGKTQPSSFQPSGRPLKKDNDDTLSQSMVAALGEQMKSVGALIHCGRVIGTVFRVGSKYVMTASHVVAIIIDPHKTGCPDVNQLESDDTYINFNESVISFAVTPYKVRKEFIENRELDVAVLEISDQTLSGLPMKMNLCVKEVSDVGVTNVSLVGYGHPGGQNTKHLDPKCRLVSAFSQRIQSAQAYAHHNLQDFRSVIQEKGGNPDLVNLGYQGYDNRCRLLFDCFMEEGASGAPALTNNNERSVQVVGILTHGLPEFYFDLPANVKPMFPNDYRLESGTKMKYIFEWMRATQHVDIVKDIFNI